MLKGEELVQAGEWMESRGLLRNWGLACRPCTGSSMKRIGEEVTEVLSEESPTGGSFFYFQESLSFAMSKGQKASAENAHRTGKCTHFLSGVGSPAPGSSGFEQNFVIVTGKVFRHKYIISVEEIEEQGCAGNIAKAFCALPRGNLHITPAWAGILVN